MIMSQNILCQIVLNFNHMNLLTRILTTSASHLKYSHYNLREAHCNQTFVSTTSQKGSTPSPLEVVVEFLGIFNWRFVVTFSIGTTDCLLFVVVNP